jgi:arginase
LARGVDVDERGNLDGPLNPWLGPVDGFRLLELVEAWNLTVMDAVAGADVGGRADQ